MSLYHTFVNVILSQISLLGLIRHTLVKKPQSPRSTSEPASNSRLQLEMSELDPFVSVSSQN